VSGGYEGGRRHTHASTFTKSVRGERPRQLFRCKFLFLLFFFSSQGKDPGGHIRCRGFIALQARVDMNVAGKQRGKMGGFLREDQCTHTHASTITSCVWWETLQAGERKGRKCTGRRTEKARGVEGRSFPGKVSGGCKGREGNCKGRKSECKASEGGANDVTVNARVVKVNARVVEVNAMVVKADQWVVVANARAVKAIARVVRRLQGS
jgi:hypothetical protein